MTSAEYYFENQVNQFYRIIFFFIELRARGISTDKDDIYEGPLPYNVVPKEVQAIIYDNDVYRDYLLSERKMIEILITTETENIFIQNLVETARVYEEDLLMSWNTAPISGIQFRDTAHKIILV